MQLLFYISLARSLAMQLLQLAAAPLATYAARSSAAAAKSEFRHPRVHQTAAFCLAAAAPLCIFKSYALSHAFRWRLPPPPSFFSVHQRDLLESRRALLKLLQCNSINNQFGEITRWLLCTAVFFHHDRKRWLDWIGLIGNALFSSVRRAVG
jgi:hypothetical protein